MRHVAWLSPPPLLATVPALFSEGLQAFLSTTLGEETLRISHTSRGFAGTCGTRGFVGTCGTRRAAGTAGTRGAAGSAVTRGATGAGRTEFPFPLALLSPEEGC